MKNADASEGRGDRPRRATLFDVAELAGVSQPTVSKVINGHPDISFETRERVQRALDEVGYTKRHVRPPTTTRSVEVMVDQLGTAYAMEVLRGVALAAETADVDVVVSRFHRAAPDSGWLAPGDWAKRLARAGRTGAIILTAQLGPGHIAGLTQEHLPVVVIDPLDLTNRNVPSVGSTNWAGGYSATEHLIALGHTRIGAMGGRRESIAAVARLHGFRAACASAGIAVDEDLVRFATFDYEAGIEVGEEWLARDDRPTAIFAASDTSAMGILEAARRQGLSVPRDLSVVGYDDTYLASWSTPPLTTVRQPLFDMGGVALRTVLDAAEGREPASRHIELATTLVVRGTTAAPGKEA
ncbi:LacI family DNA-binding transcriptional regulator [Microbacterium ulmi]|uniref:Substrate-binding domain-containing protein n=1 Tax=Microbacterium ulmi TaxID=179095 RepID=A0A7Y2Q242_9MICO|nr:substrate-binding domain-containing protein [Microbacterium ulmi]NII68590.1 LacI family transcriptional regulator [Microbacterium ulmi]NNH05037.1 substrate-binding domain-containing protein [Microbacterium ulmi]